MRNVVLTAMALTGLAFPASAGDYAGCSKAQTQIVGDALDHAKELTLRAASSVGDTPEYNRWFGTYSTANAETVRATLKAVVTAMRSGAMKGQCNLTTHPGCRAGEYAWVYPDQPFIIHICPPFFGLPNLTALRPGQPRSDNGTREGTMVHEISHFIAVADTADHCYSREDCSLMADSRPDRAIENADSYQYFTEDVTYYARQPVAGKPAPAPRTD